MGTRGEIYVRNSNSVVELWRHFDTYAGYMEPYFRLFAKYAAWAVGSQRHWLTYPEDVAAMLIAFDYEVLLTQRTRLYTKEFFEARPDLKPRGNINDFEMVWILDVPNENQDDDILWRVRGFNFWSRPKGAPSGFRGLSAEKMREAVRRMEDHVLERCLRKVSDFLVKPENDGKGCRMCGYPGPLLLVEEPPLCIYCLARRVRSDDFVREQVEQILKIAPLISDS